MSQGAIPEKALKTFVFEYAKRVGYRGFFLPDIAAALAAALPHLVAARDARIATLEAELAAEREYSERVDALHGTGKRRVGE